MQARILSPDNPINDRAILRFRNSFTLCAGRLEPSRLSDLDLPERLFGRVAEGRTTLPIRKY
jgi:hypothetical protein